MRSLSLYSKNPTTIIQRSQVWMHFKFCDIVWSLLSPIDHQKLIPDSNVGWANFGPTPGRQFRRWAHVGPTCISVWVHIICGRPMSHKYRYTYQHHYNSVIMGSMASQITRLMIVYSTVYSSRRSKEASKLRVNGLCARNSPVTGEFPTQMASNAEMFPFDAVIMVDTCISYTCTHDRNVEGNGPVCHCLWPLNYFLRRTAIMHLLMSERANRPLCGGKGALITRNPPLITDIMLM